jgi:hypothetical protein
MGVLAGKVVNFSTVWVKLSPERHCQHQTEANATAFSIVRPRLGTSYAMHNKIEKSPVKSITICFNSPQFFITLSILSLTVPVRLSLSFQAGSTSAGK